MTLTLDLPSDLEERLTQEADQRGLPVEEYAVAFLQKHLRPVERGEAVRSLLEKWINEGDVAEQSETGELLIQTLDEDRLSLRKLFPPDLKGQTW